MAYATDIQVAQITRMWTRAGEFLDPDGLYDDGTNPTLTTVEDWLDKVSSQMDLALAQSWFVTPISSTDYPSAYGAISQQVAGLVADLVNYANSSGRLYTDKTLQASGAPFAQIARDLAAWVSGNADGFVAMGVPQVKKVNAKRLAGIRMMGHTGSSDYPYRP